MRHLLHQMGLTRIKRNESSQTQQQIRIRSVMDDLIQRYSEMILDVWRPSFDHVLIVTGFLLVSLASRNIFLKPSDTLNFLESYFTHRHTRLRHLISASKWQNCSYLA